MANELHVGHERQLLVSPLDDEGNAAEVENLSWSVPGQEETVAKCVFKDDGTWWLQAGNTIVKGVRAEAKADARIGEGEHFLIESLEFDIIAEEAGTLNPSLGTEERPIA